MAEDARAAWVERVLGIHLPGTSATTDNAGDLGRALRGWQSAREQVVTQLRGLSDAIAKARDPESTPAIILLQAIIKNLTPSPASTRQVKELDRYLRTDDIIDEAESPHGFGPKIAIRVPLLAALAKLQATVPA